MKLLFFIFLYLVLNIESYSQYVFNFSSKDEKVIILMSTYSSKGIYQFTKAQKINKIVYESKLEVNELKLESFKDSLLDNGYKLGVSTKLIKKPYYIIKLKTYDYSYKSPKGDSIFDFSIDLVLYPSTKKEKIIECGNYETFSSQSELENNFVEIDTYRSSYLHKGTTIRRLWFELEKVSRKPFIYFDDGTIMDYNYSASVMY